MRRQRTIGVISDTHGLLRDEALEALDGVHHVLHAGDVGDPDIVRRLAEIAPVTLVRGNVDTQAWAAPLPATEVVEFGRVTVYMLHDLCELDLDPAKAGFAAVISGHTHRPSSTMDHGVLFLNPGSAGPRRFDLPVSVARVVLDGDTLDAQLIELDV